MATNLKMVSKITAANVRDRVYHLVKSIPKGKVATYGQIADQFKILNLKFKINARMIGRILHQNRDLKVPCHRVVDRKGRLAPNFAFGGWKEQKRRLEIEGVNFIDETHVDLEKCLWRGKF